MGVPPVVSIPVEGKCYGKECWTLERLAPGVTFPSQLRGSVMESLIFSEESQGHARFHPR